MIRSALLGACATDAGPFDAGDASERDAPESPFDATTDAPSSDAPASDAPELDGAVVVDASADATPDAAEPADSGLDASRCVALSVGAYEVDGAIPTACPAGEGEAPPAPVLSPALSLGHVNDLVEVLRAELLERLRRLEMRVLDADKGTGRSG